MAANLLADAPALQQKNLDAAGAYRHRRHLSASQRAMVAAKVATLEVGRPSNNPAIAVISQHEAADLLNLSVDSVQRARVVQRDAIAEVAGAVERDDISVCVAAAFRL